MNITMDTRYSPKDFEDRIYQKWIDSNSFKASNKSNKEPFTIVMPPPNITGQLHMGHALDHTIQDAIIRYKRLMNFETLWLPGTDHASIATEVKVWEQMEKEGRKKEETSREDFLKRAWEWKEEYENRIIEQTKKLGDSCDWSRLRFTMDESLSNAVLKVFVDLYNKGLIYKGYRLVNWCCDCGTSLSDAEVEHEEKDSSFYHVNYKMRDSDEVIEIATTRPETIFGDTAVAVNPDDSRYSHLIGKYVIIPIVNREVKIIGDDYVDIELGTGALKVTPSHDPNDFEIGIRHNLESINVLNENGTMSDVVPEYYRGMSRVEARKAIVKEIEEIGQLVQVKPLRHNVGVCYRCHNDIEPWLSNQWFVKMEELAKPAIEALDKDLFFIPDRFSKIYLHWLNDIRDWCISRQLWWGHRIPAYYCSDCDELHVALEKPNACTKCASTNLYQDEDVLDTWFSSALWPFSTLGWPDETDDFKKFYPTSTLVTGFDIIFFWVVRMVFSGIENTGKSPFKDVVIHGLVRDEQGRKMSKSLGNGIDPLEVIEKYGADALRFMLLTGNTPGNDQRYIESKVEAARNFANKLWNASRFVLMGVSSTSNELDDVNNLSLADKWILQRLYEVKSDYIKHMDNYDIAIAGDKLYEFIWNEYCDWYIEIAKISQNSGNPERKKQVEIILIHVLREILIMMHPFMPFITEEIWQQFNDKNLVTSELKIEENRNFELDVVNMNIIMNAIKSIRNARAELNISNSKKAKVFILSDVDGQLFNNNKLYFINLANASDVELIEDKSSLPKDVIACVSNECEIFMPSDDLIDFEKELVRLQKEAKKLISEVERGEKKLANEKFISKAPAKLVEEEKIKLQKYQQSLVAVNSQIRKISSKV